jgi:hypothetical protein
MPMGMIVARMLVRMDMGLILMGVGMNMDEVIFLQELHIGQYLGRRAAPYYLFVMTEYINYIRDLLNGMHVVRSGDYCLPVGVILIQKIDKIS